MGTNPATKAASRTQRTPAAEMAAVQQNSGGRDSAIDIEAGTVEGANAAGGGGGGGGCVCTVCMEPMQWAAHGQCGHRDVCASCAIRIRSSGRDRRCCICRTHCPTVYITNASKPMMAAGGAGRGGKCWYYHEGAAAYFDDEQLYREMVSAVSRPARGRSSNPDVQLRRRAAGRGTWMCAFYIAICCFAAVIYFSIKAKHWGARVVFFLGGAFLVCIFGFFTSVITMRREEEGMEGTSVSLTIILGICSFLLFAGASTAHYYFKAEI